ncbi:MAG: hypothetical protein IH899_20055, partial [Planctomycetes bacterium]|nr:hypothetical protein [Planctomycetota bacterium]
MSAKSSLPVTEKEINEHLGTAKPTRDPWWNLILSVMLPASGFGSLLAWMLPRTKPNAVLGRLDYWQSAQAVILTAMFFSFAVVVCSPENNRRVRVFRVLAIWLGVLVAIILSESIALFLPLTYITDNPWYGAAEGSDRMAKDSDQLMFERPPHLKWHGLSRGDFAFPVDGEDPYARMVTFETDFEGFRNSVDISQADVIFLGDSFTEAGNVPEKETFVERTVRKLNVSGRNLGRASHGPSAELIILEKYGLKCQPRFVVWQICESNDLEDEVNFRKWIDLGRPALPALYKLTRFAAWKRRSPTYHLFKRLRKLEPWPYRGTFRDARGSVHPMLFIWSPPDESIRPAGHPGWPLMAETLGKGAALLSKHDIELLVLLIPKKIRVMGPYVEFSQLSRQLLPS